MTTNAPFGSFPAIRVVIRLGFVFEIIPTSLFQVQALLRVCGVMSHLPRKTVTFVHRLGRRGGTPITPSPPCPRPSPPRPPVQPRLSPRQRKSLASPAPPPRSPPRSAMARSARSVWPAVSVGRIRRRFVTSAAGAACAVVRVPTRNGTAKGSSCA